MEKQTIKLSCLLYGYIGNAPHRVSGFVFKGKLFPLLILACLICSNAEPGRERLNLPDFKLWNTRGKEFGLTFHRAKKYHPESSWQLLDPKISPSSEAPICPDKGRLHFHLPATREMLWELEEKPAIVSLPKPSGSTCREATQ